ncbi:hypothetical protein R5R35_002399 [Gryllus longicercus]|uniref:Uncharacterized protein n=1 Tax=Gryllus longicercus TaxID=2509291 RepID=A0AAN9ZEF2_9ORTH
MKDNLHNGGITNSLMKAWLSSFPRPRQDELFRVVLRQVRNLNLPFPEVQRAMCQLTRKTSVPIRKLSCSQRDPLTRKKKRRRRIIIDSDSDEDGNDYKTNIHISDAHDHMEESNALPQSSLVGVPISNPNIVEVAEIINLVDSDEEIQESPTKNIHLCRKRRFAKFFGSDSEDETDTIKLSEKSVSCVLIKDCDSDCSDELCVNERVKRKNKKLKLKNSDITLCAVEVKEEVLASDVQNENTISCQKSENKLTKSGVSEHISTVIQEKSYPSPTEVLKNVIIIVDSPENSPVMIDEEKYISDECLQKNKLENKLRREHNQDVQGVSQAENIQRNSPGAEPENSSSTPRGLIEQVSTSESLTDSTLQKNDNSDTTSISEKQITSGGENQQEATVTSSGLPLSPQETCPIGGPRTGQIWVKDNRSLGISENWNASNLNQTKDQIAISALSSTSDLSGFDQESIKCGEDAVNLISEFASNWNKKDDELKALIQDNDVVSNFRKKVLAAEKQTLVTYIQENVVVIFKKLVEKIQSVEKTEELIRLHISKRETSKGLIPHFNAIWKNFIYLHREEARPPETEGSVSHDSSSQTFVSDVANACADTRVSLIDSNNLLTIEPQRSKRESVGTVSHSKQWYQIAELNTPHTQSGQSRPFTTMSDHLPSVPSPAVDFSLSMSNPSVSQQRTSSSSQQMIQNSQMQLHNSQSIDLGRNERKQQSGGIEEQLLHQQNTSNIIDESVVQQEPYQNQGSNQQSHFPEPHQLQTVQTQNVLSNQGPQQQQLVERNQLHQQQLGQSYFISHMRQTQAQVQIPVRCQAQQQESYDSASQHQVLRSMSQDQIQPHNQQLILQSIQMLEQEMKRLKERYELLKLQDQHNPQLEGEQQKIVQKLITLSLQRQLQLAQLLPQQQQQVQGAQLPQQQQQVQGVQLPQQQQQVQGVQLPQQQQQVQRVQLPQQQQQVQRVQLPQQQQQVQRVQLPQQQQHVQRVQLPQQQQQVQRVQLPQQQQQVQRVQLPQQQQQVQRVQLPQQQQHMQRVQLPQQQQHVQRVQLPQQQQQVQRVQLPQQEQQVQRVQLPQQQQQVQRVQLPQQQQQVQRVQLPQQQQQVQRVQLPQQQQQVQRVQLPQQQQQVQRVQLPQQQQQVQRVQLPQQQQQVQRVQLPQQQELQRARLSQQQQQQELQRARLSQQQQQQDLQRARFSQQQQQQQDLQRARFSQQQQEQQQQRAQLPQQQQLLPQLQHKQQQQFLQQQQLLPQQQPQLQPQLKQSLLLQHLEKPVLPAGAEAEKQQQQPQSQPQQQYPRSLQESQHPYARLHHQLDQQHLQQSPQITQQQQKVQPLEQKRQDVYLLQQPHKQLLIVENKRRITSDCGESWCVPDHEKQKQSVLSLQSVSPQTVTNTIVPPTSAVQKCSMTPVSNALAQNLQSSYSVSSESSSRSELNLGILLQSSSCSGTHQSSASSAISELSLSNLLKNAGTSSSGSHQSCPSSAMVKNQLQLPPPNPSHSFSTDSSQTLPTILELSMPSSKTSTVMPEIGVSSLSNSVRVISNEILSEVSESDQNEIRAVMRVKEVNKQLLQECKNVEKVMEGTDINLEIANVRPSVLRIHENGGDIETRTECSRQMPGSVKLVFDNDLRQGGKPEGLNDGRTEDLIEMQLVDTGTKNVISTVGDTCSVIKPMDISNEIDATVKENKSQCSRQNDLVEIAVNAISENKPFTQKENNGKDSQSSETEFQVGNKITIIDHNESSSSIIEGLGSRSEEKLPPEVHGTEHEEETDEYMNVLLELLGEPPIPTVNFS